MKIKYRNFRRVINVRPIHGGSENILILLFVASLFGALAYNFKDSSGLSLILLVPAMVCAYGVALEIVAIFSGNSDKKDP